MESLEREELEGEGLEREFEGIILCFYVPEAYLMHFTYRCWFKNCSGQAVWVGGGGGGIESPPPTPTGLSEFTLSRWGRGVVSGTK
jgi:hypothetical protein